MASTTAADSPSTPCTPDTLASALCTDPCTDGALFKTARCTSRNALRDVVCSSSVNAVPIGVNEVFILVEFGSIEEDNRIIQIQSALDLRKGIVFSRIGSREV